MGRSCACCETLLSGSNSRRPAPVSTGAMKRYPNNTINGIGMPVGPTRFVESVTVSPDGNHFSGTFTLDAYDVTGKIDVQSYTGVITATRITTSTTIGDLV